MMRKKEYEGLIVNVSNDQDYYGNEVENLEAVINQWENYILEKFPGIEIEYNGGTSCQGHEIIEEPENFDLEEFVNDLETAWVRFCEKD